MRRWAACVILAAALSGCGAPEPLEVWHFHLRDLVVDSGRDPMIRGEELARLHGAVSVREREQRLGYYYSVRWHDDGVGEPARVVMRYRQAATGSRILRKERQFEPASREGRAEFEVIGDDYLEGGRVLAWRIALLRGGREIASEQSYLWE